MDGLLVDSEPLWWRAGVDVLRTVGVDLNDAQLHETMGLRTDAALAHWHSRYPWTGKTLPQVEQEIEARMLQLIRSSAQPLPGVWTLVNYLHTQGIPMGVCSSSPYSVISVVLSTLQFEPLFQAVHSAQDEPLGKPHPGAYLSCAARLGVSPQRCVAFEDSLAGAISAKAARMKVVAVPSSRAARPTSFDFCDARLDSLANFTPDLLRRIGWH